MLTQMIKMTEEIMLLMERLQRLHNLYESKDYSHFSSRFQFEAYYWNQFIKLTALINNQIRLIKNCSNRDGYEWGFTDTVPNFFIVIFRNLTLCAEKFGLDVDVRINGRDIEDVFEEAEAKFNEH